MAQEVKELGLSPLWPLVTAVVWVRSLTQELSHPKGWPKKKKSCEVCLLQQLACMHRFYWFFFLSYFKILNIMSPLKPKPNKNKKYN